MIFRAVAAEDALAIFFVVDVASDPFQIEAAAGHNGDIDPTLVVAVDQHDVLIGRAMHQRQEIVMKPDQRRTALGLDQSDDVGTNLVDHLGGHSRRNFVDRFHLEVE